jgi:DNA-binding MarR family transcriptional regulator
MKNVADRPGLSRRTVRLTGKDLADAIRLLHVLTPTGAAADLVRPPRSELISLAHSLWLLRQLRGRIFPAAMFAEPAWDILLALYARLGRQKPRITEVAELSGAPASTAFRWIEYLEAHDFIVREAAPHDRRVALVSLTEQAIESLESYLSQALGSAP